MKGQLMVFHIFLIAGPVIGLIIGLVLAYIYRDYYYTSYLWNAFIGAFSGFIIGALIGLIVSAAGASNTATDNGYTNVAEYELVALATQQETESSAGMLIFVGWSQSGEVRKAYWTAKDEDGIAQMYSRDALSIRIKETETTPRYVEQAMIDDSRFWFPQTYKINEREYLEVPYGTLTTNYEFQP